MDNKKIRNNKEVNIIYHGKDFDGIGSAAIIVDQLKEQGYEGKFNLYPMEHGDQLKYVPKKNDSVFILGCALDMPKMLDIANKGDLYWIDHHKTKKQELENFEKRQELEKKAKHISLDNSSATCSQTYKFFNKNKDSKLVGLLNDFEMFNKSNQEALFLNYGLTAMKKFQNPQYKGWRQLLKAQGEATSVDKPNMLDRFIENGKWIKSYMFVDNKKMCKRSFDVQIGEYKGIAINRRDQGRQVFNPIKDKNNYDFFLTYKLVFKDGKMRYNFVMYKEDAKVGLDFSKLVKDNFVGRGHKDVAGFEHDEFPVDLIRPLENSISHDKEAIEETQKKDKKNKKESVNIIYHGGDFDGIGSAAILINKLRDDKYSGDINLYPMDRGSELEYKPIKGDQIYVLDYSLDMDKMLEFAKKGNLYWIDHHETSKKELDEFSKKDVLLKQIKHLSLDMDSAACKQTWNYCSNGEKSKLVDLLNSFDLYDKENKDAFTLDYAMKSVPSLQNPKGESWKELIESSRGKSSQDKVELIDKYIDKGFWIKSYLYTQNEKKCKKDAFEVQIGEFRGLALNNSGQGSKVFGAVKNKEKYDFLLTFGLTYKKGKPKFNFGLYSDNKKTKFNCAKFAEEKFGGGGHKGAAGFRLSYFPSEIIKPVKNKLINPVKIAVESKKRMR